VATYGENGEFEDDDVEFGALSGEKTDGGGGGGKPPVAKPSADVAPWLKWGNAYQPAGVNVRPGDSLNRTQWVEAYVLAESVSVVCEAGQTLFSTLPV